MKVNNFMQSIYYFASAFYLSSYTPDKYGTVYDYHVMIYSLKTNQKSSKITIPIKERIRFAISVFPVLYYSIKGFKLIDFNETIPFIVGDLFVIIDNVDKTIIINASLLITFCLIMLWFSLYYTYNLRLSLGFCTMIQCWSEIERNEQILLTIPQKFSEYSLSTLIILNYGHSMIRKFFSKFKFFFIKFYYFIQPFHRKFY